jgi:hypothetical protein
VNGAKSLTDLAIEVERGETTLALDDVTNAPRRDVRVLRLLVTDEAKRPGPGAGGGEAGMGEWTSSVSKHAAVGKAARERGLARRGDDARWTRSSAARSTRLSSR